MKLAIFGATGGTGRLLVEQALAAGHEVIAFARTPSKLTEQHERLVIIQGDLTDAAAIERALCRMEAVISALGPRGNDASRPITRGTLNILAAMKKHGVRRLVLSSTPSARDPNDVPDLRFKLAVGLVRLVLRSAYEDIVSTAQAVRASDVDWTIVRASMLSDAPRTGAVRVGYVGRAVGMRISRSDLAEFMLKQVLDTAYLRQSPAVSN